MTALAMDRKTDQVGTPDIVLPQLYSLPVEAATTLYGGAIVASNASGFAVPGATSNALVCWGRCEKQVVNTVAAGYGSQGELPVSVRSGAFDFASGTGGDTIAQANIGQLCYLIDDQTVGLLNPGGNTRSIAGTIVGIAANGQIQVLMGPLFANVSTTVNQNVLTARGVVLANIANLAAFTVASNDGLTYSAGQLVLLAGQTTASQNGLYQVGTVSVGAAPLTRVSQMASGAAIIPGMLISVAEGTLFSDTIWKATANSGTIGTNDPAFYPCSVTLAVTLIAGHLVVTSVPVLSTTKSNFLFSRKTANTCTATIQYVGLSPAAGVATASVDVTAAIDAGTINVADISTVLMTVVN